MQLTAHLNLVELLGHPVGATITLPAELTPVYNMQAPPGTPLEADFKVALFETVVHIVGGIDWSGDYHEFFTINEIPKSPELVESRLIFNGKALVGGGTLPFITMPSTCLGPQTTGLEVESYESQRESKSFTTPVGASGCDKVPFQAERMDRTGCGRKQVRRTRRDHCQSASPPEAKLRSNRFFDAKGRSRRTARRHDTQSGCCHRA